jgi:hypothetical protein
VGKIARVQHARESRFGSGAMAVHSTSSEKVLGTAGGDLFMPRAGDYSAPKNTIKKCVPQTPALCPCRSIPFTNHMLPKDWSKGRNERHFMLFMTGFGEGGSTTKRAMRTVFVNLWIRHNFSCLVAQINFLLLYSPSPWKSSPVVSSSPAA